MIRVDRKLNSTDVVDALTDLFILRGPPEFVRSDNGPEFIAEKVRDWIGAVGAKTAFIEPGSPWENGYCEVVQLPIPRRAPRRRDLLLAPRGPDPDRTVAPTLQYGQAAQRPRIPAAGSGKLHHNGPETDHALTIQPDHSMGAVHGRGRATIPVFPRVNHWVVLCIKRRVSVCSQHVSHSSRRFDLPCRHQCRPPGRAKGVVIGIRPSEPGPRRSGSQPSKGPAAGKPASWRRRRAPSSRRCA